MRLYGMYTICKSNGIQLEFELLVGVKERNSFKVNTHEIQNLLSLSRSGHRWNVHRKGKKKRNGIIATHSAPIEK